MFVSKNKAVKYSKKFQSLNEKILHNCRYIEDRRKNVTFSVKESQAIKNWEIQTLQAEPPLVRHYEKVLEARNARAKEESEMKMETEETLDNGIEKAEDDSDSVDDEQPVSQQKKPKKKKSKKSTNMNGVDKKLPSK